MASAPVASLLKDPAEGSIIPLSEHRSLISVDFLGTVQRNGARRVHSLGFDVTGMYLVVQVSKNIVFFPLICIRSSCSSTVTSLLS